LLYIIKTTVHAKYYCKYQMKRFLNGEVPCINKMRGYLIQNRNIFIFGIQYMTISHARERFIVMARLLCGHINLGS
jgi:hypothetical protein